MKRFICFLLCLLLLCGCSGPVEETPTTEATQAPPPKEITVYLSGAICDKVTWRKVTDAFTASTGILVTAVSNPEDAEVVHLPEEEAVDFLSSHPAALLPEVADTLIPGEAVTVSSKALPGLMESFAAAPNEVFQFLPLFVNGYGLGYNISLFEEKDWSVPSTWEELWTLGDAAKAEGIYLLTYTDALQLRELMYATLCSVGGPEFFRSAAHYAEGVWSSQTGKACAEIMAKLASYTHPLTPSNINAQSGENNLQLWLQNEVLFFPAGQETAASIADAEKAADFQLGIAPIMSAENGQYIYLDSHPIWISESCANPVSAIRFLAFLYSDIASDLFLEAGLTQPIVQQDLSSADLKVAAGSFRTYHAAVDAGSLRKVFLDPFGQLVNGTITKEEWIRNTEDAMTAIRGSLKN